MAQQGYISESFAFIRQVYGDYIELGAPTWGECFKNNYFGAPISRYNTAHGWGAVVNTWFVENMLGIKLLEPGFRKLEFNPFSSLSGNWEYEIKTSQGKLTIQHQDNVFILNIPKGVAVIYQGQTLQGSEKDFHILPLK